MAGQSVDGKFANVSAVLNGAQGNVLNQANNIFYGRLAIGDRTIGNAARKLSFGNSLNLDNAARTLVYLGPQDGSNKYDLFYQLSDRNIAKYPIKKANYPTEYERKQNLTVKSDSNVLISVGPGDDNSIILPARPSEYQWHYVWNRESSISGKLRDQVDVKWGLDQGKKLTLTGLGGDIVIGGPGRDFIGPGLPMKSWQSLVYSNGKNISSAITTSNVNLAKTEDLFIATTDTKGSLVSHNFRVYDKGLGQRIGRKAYVGGSDADVIWGGDQNDLLVGDRYDSYETYFPRDEDSRRRLFSAAGLDKDLLLIQSNYQNLTPKSYDGRNKVEPQYNIWYDYSYGTTYEERTCNIGPIDHKYIAARPGLIRRTGSYTSYYRAPQFDGSHTINDPVWKPSGDIIYGANGDDMIYGDNNLNNVARLYLIKAAFNTPGGDAMYFAERDHPRKTFEQVYGDLGNDFIDAGEGNDVIHGGIGKDMIIGGPGRDTVYLPDVITAPGYKNVTGQAGVASWIMGDAPGLEKKDSDLFILGLNYTTEEAMINSAIADGGEESTPEDYQQLVDSFTKQAEVFMGYVADVLNNIVKPLPIIGSALSAMLGYADKEMKKYANQGTPQINQKPNASDSVAVIVDFGREDMLMIPVAKGEQVSVQRLNDNSGVDIIQPSDKRFRSESNTKNINVQFNVSVNNKMYPRLVLQNFDNQAGGESAYQFYRFQGTGDYNYWIYAHHDLEPLMAQFDPNQASGVSSLI